MKVLFASNRVDDFRGYTPLASNTLFFDETRVPYAIGCIYGGRVTLAGRLHKAPVGNVVWYHMNIGCNRTCSPNYGGDLLVIRDAGINTLCVLRIKASNDDLEVSTAGDTTEVGSPGTQTLQPTPFRIDIRVEVTASNIIVGYYENENLVSNTTVANTSGGKGVARSIDFLSTVKQTGFNLFGDVYFSELIISEEETLGARLRRVNLGTGDLVSDYEGSPSALGLESFKEDIRTITEDTQTTGILRTYSSTENVVGLVLSTSAGVGTVDGPQTLTQSVEIGGEVFGGDVHSLERGSKPFLTTWETNPYTGVDWTPGDIDRLKVGFKAGAIATPSPAARYWRLFMTDSIDPTQTFVGLTEIEFRTAVGGTDLTDPADALAGAATSSSELSASFAAQNAFDDVVSAGADNVWTTASGDQLNAWITYDFVTPATISEVLVTGLNDPLQSPKDLKLQKSSDGTTWVDVIDFGLLSWTALEQKALAVTDATVTILPIDPYDFPILSTDATGTASDWSRFGGSVLTAWGSEPTFWVPSLTNDRVIHYQEFAVPDGFIPFIDAGNALVDLSHVIKSLGGDDGCFAIVEFLDGSTGSDFLGRGFTEDQLPTVETATSQNDIRVPPGTRVCRIGWQGFRKAGTQLNGNVKDIACTLKQGNGEATEAVMLFSEEEASLTGWSGDTGVVVILTSDGDWQRGGDRPHYAGGPTNANSRIFRTLPIPSGWADKVATGAARIQITASLFNANDDDDAGIGIEFNRPGTNTFLETGRVAITNEVIPITLDAVVPSDTIDFILDLEFWRDDGTYNDGAISQIGIFLYLT